MHAIHIVSAADFVYCNNFAYKKGIFYLNQFALVTEFLQTFSIKYSSLLLLFNYYMIFAEYPKEFALTNQPSSGRKGDRGSGERRARDLILALFLSRMVKYVLMTQPHFCEAFHRCMQCSHSQNGVQGRSPINGNPSFSNMQYRLRHPSSVSPKG